MKDLFNNIGIDKLTLCYTILPNSLLHNIKDEDTDIDMGDFKLKRIESGHFKNSFIILSLWNNPDETDTLTWQTYGILKYSRYTDKEDIPQLAWLYFENKILYQQLYQSINTVIFADYQSDVLGLQLRNITEMEIYFDTTRNASKAIKYMLRNSSVDTILNGKVLKRDEKQPMLLYLHTGTLNRYTNLTFYAKQADKDGFELKAYDKATEIMQESHKNYIYEWHNLKPNSKLYRVEVTLRHNHLKEYLNDNRIEITHNIFNDKDFLINCFIHFSFRLLRFREGKKSLSILDAII